MISAHDLSMQTDRQYREFVHAMENAVAEAAEERSYMSAKEVIPFLRWDDDKEDFQQELDIPAWKGRLALVIQEMQRLGYKVSRSYDGYLIEWGV